MELGEEIRQADFVTAYLNAKLGEEETVYMSIPDGFREWLVETKPETMKKICVRIFLSADKGEYFLKLSRSLYGLKQPARLCYNNMSVN